MRWNELFSRDVIKYKNKFMHARKQINISNNSAVYENSRI